MLKWNMILKNNEPMNAQIIRIMLLVFLFIMVWPSVSQTFLAWGSLWKLENDMELWKLFKLLEEPL